MYYRAEQILSAYPKEFTGNMKGRGSILCTDNEGIYLLKEYHGSLRRLELLDEVLRDLKGHQFLAEELVRTAEGTLMYTDIDGVNYFLRKTYQGRECDTKNAKELLTVTKHLAQLHQLLRGCETQTQVAVSSKPEDYAGKHTRELKKVRNYVRAKKKKNAFESEFLKSYGHYMAQAQQVLQLETEAPVPDGALQLCHGDFNPSNVIISPAGDYYVIDWSHATQGNASADAARTYLLFCLEGDTEMAEMYMDKFCKKSDTAKQYVQQWLPIVAASQSVKGNEEERDFLLKWIDVVDYE